MAYETVTNVDKETYEKRLKRWLEIREKLLANGTSALKLVARSESDRRKIDTDEMRQGERRAGWSRLKELGPDSDYWIGNRRRYGNRRHGLNKRTMGDRRSGTADRRGRVVPRIHQHTRDISDGMAEARAVSAGAVTRSRPKMNLELSSEPTKKYHPEPTKKRERDPNLDHSAIAETFPGFLGTISAKLRSAKKSLGF